MTSKPPTLPTRSQADCRARSCDILADLYDVVSDLQNHPTPTLVVDDSLMRFVHLLILGMSDILINLPDKS